MKIQDKYPRKTDCKFKNYSPIIDTDERNLKWKIYVNLNLFMKINSFRQADNDIKKELLFLFIFTRI